MKDYISSVTTLFVWLFNIFYATCFGLFWPLSRVSNHKDGILICPFKLLWQLFLPQYILWFNIPDDGQKGWNMWYVIYCMGLGSIFGNYCCNYSFIKVFYDLIHLMMAKKKTKACIIWCVKWPYRVMIDSIFHYFPLIFKNV